MHPRTCLHTWSSYLHLSQGMPYNYVVGHDNSTSLADAPGGIKEAVRRMTWAAKRVVAHEEFVNFNEVLAIGYFETMRMNVRDLFQPPIYVRYSLANSSQYHDDGESSLGPTVVSISLGCPAKMKWRLKMRYWSGFRDKSLKHYDPQQPILPGCRKPVERRKLNALAKTASTAELDAAAQTALAFKKGESRTPPVVLELDLHHGDYMVMHGASMQVYYEVCISRNAPIDQRLTKCSIWSPQRTNYVSALHAVMSSPRWSRKTCARWETSLSILRTPTMAISHFTRIT